MQLEHLPNRLRRGFARQVYKYPVKYSDSFLALLDHLEAFQLPVRGCSRDAKIEALIIVKSKARASAKPRRIRCGCRASIVVGACAYGARPSYGAMNAPVGIRLKASARARRSVINSRDVKVASRSRPRWPRSQEAIASASAKNRAYRQARITAVLPLVEQARSEGYLLLSEIAAYLDRIGHEAPQGSKWSVATLSQMLPPRDREARDDTFAALIHQARLEGAGSHGEITDWMNSRGHRTARGKPWTRGNLSRFIREACSADCAP